MSVGYEEAKGLMRRHLLACHDSIPQEEIDVMTEEWGEGIDFAPLDPRIFEMEEVWLAKQYKQSHVKELGNLTPTRLDGLLRWMHV